MKTEDCKRSFLDIFNSWHQGKFGRMPEYVVYRCNDSSPWKKDGAYYKCDIIFYVPENDKGIEGKQCFVDKGETRSRNTPLNPWRTAGSATATAENSMVLELRAEK